MKPVYVSAEIISVNNTQVWANRILGLLCICSVFLSPFGIIMLWMANSRKRYEVRLTDTEGMQSVQLLYEKKYRAIAQVIETAKAINVRKALEN